MGGPSREPGWLDRRSRLLTVIGTCLALCAAAATVAYLELSRTGLWLNLLVALAVLAAPLATRAPLTGLRLMIASVVWIVVGLPGGYFFGTSVFLAGLLLAATLLVEGVLSQHVVNARPGTTEVTEGEGPPPE